METEKKGLTIKSQHSYFGDWSTSDIESPEAREAAEWLIANGYADDEIVKDAFQWRQTAYDNDKSLAATIAWSTENKIVQVAEQIKQNAEKKEEAKALEKKEFKLSADEQFALLTTGEVNLIYENEKCRINLDKERGCYVFKDGSGNTADCKVAVREEKEKIEQYQKTVEKAYQKKYQDVMDNIESYSLYKDNGKLTDTETAHEIAYNLYRNEIEAAQKNEFASNTRFEEFMTDKDRVQRIEQREVYNKGQQKNVSLMIKSQVEGWDDWSTADFDSVEARVAAEWLISNGFEDNKDVKSAFYDRQTSSYADFLDEAIRQDEAKIVRVAEELKQKVANEKKEVTALDKKDDKLKSNSEKYRAVNSKRIDAIEKNTPAEMKALDNWCAYKVYWDTEKQKHGKTVVDVNTGKWAKSNEPGTWASFGEALAYARDNNCAGLAFALSGSGITCIDLDGCLENGKLNDVAKDLVKNLTTFTERSVSGKGLHIFIKDDIIGQEYKNRIEYNGQEIEVYNSARFMSMTGDVMNRSDMRTGNALGACPDEVKKDLQEKLGKKTVEQKRPIGSSSLHNQSDDQVIERIKRSKKGDDFDRLFSGQSLTGDNSQDDFKMLNMLAFFTNCNADQMERIFKSSGLYRGEKKDRYLQHSIDKAINTLSVIPSNFRGNSKQSQK